MTPTRTTVAAVGALTLVGLAGCAQLSEKRLEYTRTETARIDQVTIEPGAGDVLVRTGTGTDVTIKRVVRYRGGEPDRATYRIDGTGLFLDTDCGETCSVSYEVLAPAAVSVRGGNGSGDLTVSGVATVDVTLGSGDVRVTGASGDVRAETGSGDVSVVDARAAVRVRTGSGTVTGDGLGTGPVTAEAGSGDVRLVLTTGNAVQARTGTGSVELTVPAGRYRVEAETGSGSREVGVADDPAATTVLRVSTGSGDLRISQR